jgi:hypothetical protein
MSCWLQQGVKSAVSWGGWNPFADPQPLGVFGGAPAATEDVCLESQRGWSPSF